MMLKQIGLVGLLLCTSGCLGPGPLGKGVASIDLPSDPCPGDDRAAAAARPAAAALFAGLPAQERRLAKDPLAVGVAIIRAAADRSGVRDARAADPTLRYATNVEDALGADLSVLADQLDDVDPEGAEMADKVLLSDPLAQLAPSAGDDRSARVDTIVVSRKQWQALSQDVYRTTARAGWTASFARALGETAQGTSRSGGNAASLADLRKKYLIAAYMVAYFRNGAILSASVDTAKIKEALVAKLKEKVKDETILAAAQAEIDKLADGLAKQACSNGAAGKDSCIVFGAIGEQTFVTRAGKSYGFPGISVSFDPTAERKISTNKLSTDDIASDLVRVVLEATGDEIFHVPGTPNSTLCAFNPAYCGTNAQALVLAKVNDIGDKTEAAATGTVGTLIRGGWILSLNNELLAKTVTTGIAVSFRKTAEGVAWKRLSACSASRDARTPNYQTKKVAFVN